MFLENNLKKFKETPESFRQMFGLAGLTVTIIISFMILNVFFGVGDKSAEGNKTGESNETVVTSLPKGRLNFFEGNEGHKLSASEYKAVCKNTRIVVQRAMIGANITDYEAKKLYSDNGTKIVIGKSLNSKLYSVSITRFFI